jgi:hypothetical protein
MKTTNRDSSAKKSCLYFLIPVVAFSMMLLATVKTGFSDETITVTGDDSRDSFIAENAPNINFGDSTLLSLGRDSDAAGSEYGIYLQFDFSSIPENAIIENANLILYRYMHAGGLSIDINRVTSYWPENNVKWNNTPHQSSTKWATFFTSTSGSAKR